MCKGFHKRTSQQALRTANFTSQRALEPTERQEERLRDVTVKPATVHFLHALPTADLTQSALLTLGRARLGQTFHAQKLLRARPPQ